MMTSCNNRIARGLDSWRVRRSREKGITRKPENTGSRENEARGLVGETDGAVGDEERLIIFALRTRI
ncbi:MAG: hypothetical protein C7B43_12470 [Sulfobacillus benefaciens]|uniref:Uncharacterized protein n=1 Tax=Sulfobacillus benefaciens TaxID=453960 RepID=A0A2T2WY24_9FIRM|nr:MAG: hypothetical protein C7B43_12470 [Sulfobacillus benefaciens]